jgi:DNA-binding transcriptional MerR regulator
LRVRRLSRIEVIGLSNSSERDKLQKLYFRIGEVATIVGVEPHVLRYWEGEFRSVRPQKSARGQRIYSRRDVETLLKVKELLYAHRFTIAGARRRLREGGPDLSAPEPDVAPLHEVAAPLPRADLASLRASGAPQTSLDSVQSGTRQIRHNSAPAACCLMAGISALRPSALRRPPWTPSTSWTPSNSVQGN